MINSYALCGFVIEKSFRDHKDQVPCRFGVLCRLCSQSTGLRRSTIITTRGFRDLMTATRTTTIRTTITASVVSGDESSFFVFSSELTFKEVYFAYLECRKNKRNTLYAQEFEFELERNLFQLYDDLIFGNYEISQSIAFVVEQPKIREIWAANFRDRIVHHIIYNRLSPRFYPTFIRDTFACIPGRGVMDGSNRLFKGMRSITENWKKDSYYLQADIRSFFINIDKPILFELLRPRIYEDWLLKIVKQVLFHDPRSNCYLKSTRNIFNRVPRHKSLWSTPLNKGLPIGNLTSQFFANVYLNEFDQFMKRDQKIKHYYRYVDDWVILHDSPDVLNQTYRAAEHFLKSKLELELHPFKRRLAPLWQGVDFIGFVHKPFYRRLRNRTANKMVSLVHQWKKNPSGFEHDSLVKLRNSMNSYFGLSRRAKTYRLRKHVGDQINSLFIRPDKDYFKLVV